MRKKIQILEHVKKEVGKYALVFGTSVIRTSVNNWKNKFEEGHDVVLKKLARPIILNYHLTRNQNK